MSIYLSRLSKLSLGLVIIFSLLSPLAALQKARAQTSLPSVVFSPSSSFLRVDQKTGEVKLSLSAKPSAKVRINLTTAYANSLNTAATGSISLAKTAFDFTIFNFDKPQTVSFTISGTPHNGDQVGINGKGDTRIVNHGIYTAVFTNAKQGDDNILTSPSSLSYAAGGTASVQVSLSTAPAAGETVALSFSLGTSGVVSSVDPKTLNFTSSNTPQTVTLTFANITNPPVGEFPIDISGSSGSHTYHGSIQVAVGGVALSGSEPGFGAPLVQLLSDPSGFVYKSWAAVRVVINLLLIIALLVISFSNILRINIDTYTIKKALPNLVIGVILANASFLIVKYMADIATVATYLFVGLPAGVGHPSGYATFTDFFAQVMANLGVNTIQTTGVIAGVVSPLLLIIFIIIAFVLIIWLAFLLYFRLVAIYLLTILAPLAFVAYGIPGLEKYFKQWWQQFIKWLFILPAMCAVFWLMLVIGNNSGGDNNNPSIASLIIMYALFFMGLSLPSKMGGAIIDKASKAFKNGAKLGYGASQAGGANMGLKGLGLEARGKALSKQAEAARLAGKNAQAALLDRRAGLLKASGKTLQNTGKVIVTPSGVIEGYKAKIGAQKKGREMFVEGSPAYEKFAGADVVYGNKRKKAKEEFDGLSKEILSGRLNKPDYTDIRQRLQGLDEDTRNTILYGTPFRSGATAQNFGFKGKELDNLAEYVEAYRGFDIDRRRSRGGGRRPSWGDDDARNYDPAVQTTQPPAGGATPYGDINNPELQEKIKDMKIHYDHFTIDAGPQVAGDIARLGAQLDEELDDAIQQGEEGAMGAVIEKGKDFFEKAGYSRLVPLSGQTTYENAVDMQAKIKRATQAADAVSRQLPVERAAMLDTLHQDTAANISQQVAGASSPQQQAEQIEKNQQVQQIINNHITQQAQIMGNSLDPRQIQQLSLSVRQGLMTDLTNKKTLNKIFGSEKFRQSLNNSIAQSAANTPPPPVANQQPYQPPAPPTPAAPPIQTPPPVEPPPAPPSPPTPPTQP